MLRAQLVLLPGLSKACATHEASAGFGAARLRAMRNPSASAAPDVERVQSVEMDVLSGDGTVAIDEFVRARAETCLLYTSDAADEEDSVDLGGRRSVKK